MSEHSHEEPTSEQDDPAAHEHTINMINWWNHVVVILEVAILFVFFFLIAASAPPNVNESHYLTKAKQYWNPEWCANDIFLNSGDAHLVFYWTIGWLTLLFELPTVAWIGRVAAWLLIAFAWQRMSFSILPRKLVSIATAGFTLALIEHFHMAGEWLIGGVEAKCFAFGFVFIGISALIRGHWRTVWIWFGIASAFHVLVGGWSVIAAIIAWILYGRGREKIGPQIPWLIGGGLLSLPGLIPVLMLNRGIDTETISIANQIYVFGRLEHHLVFSAFNIDFIIRHLAMTGIWHLIAIAAFVLRRRTVYRLNTFVYGALVITAIGIAIDQFILVQMNDQSLAASLLRFYWYRMTDVMIPIGFTFSVASFVFPRSDFSCRLIDSERENQPDVKPISEQSIAKQTIARKLFGGLSPLHRRNKSVVPLQGRYVLVAPILLVCFVGVSIWLVKEKVHDRLNDARPKADQKMVWYENVSANEANAFQRDWEETCAWIRENTAENAVFFTPRNQQSFKWYSLRSEVVNGKDVPQDARRIVQWQKRFQDVYPPVVEYSRFTVDSRLFGLFAYDDRSIEELAKKYEANYLVIDWFHERNRVMRLGKPKFERVFPKLDGSKRYSVYRLR